MEQEIGWFQELQEAFQPEVSHQDVQMRNAITFPRALISSIFARVYSSYPFSQKDYADHIRFDKSNWPMLHFSGT